MGLMVKDFPLFLTFCKRPLEAFSDLYVCYVTVLTNVAAARKVSPNWSQQTMTCHSFNCFSIVWGTQHW